MVVRPQVLYQALWLLTSHTQSLTVRTRGQVLRAAYLPELSLHRIYQIVFFLSDADLGLCETPIEGDLVLESIVYLSTVSSSKSAVIVFIVMCRLVT